MTERSDPPFDQGLFLVHLNRGKQHFENRRFADAADELQDARRLRPNDDTVLNLLGLSYFKQEKYGEADSIYRRLVEDHADSFTLHFNLGLIGFKLGHLDDAEATFLRSLEIRPDNQKVHFYLGNIYERKGQHYNAIFQYRKAGANIMVKRVQEKIESGQDGAPTQMPVPPSTAARPREPAPPPQETISTPIVEPEWDDQDNGSTLEVVNVDTIDRSRFLSAIRDGLSGTAAAGVGRPPKARASGLSGTAAAGVGRPPKAPASGLSGTTAAGVGRPPKAPASGLSGTAAAGVGRPPQAPASPPPQREQQPEGAVPPVKPLAPPVGHRRRASDDSVEPPPPISYSTSDTRPTYEVDRAKLQRQKDAGNETLAVKPAPVDKTMPPQDLKAMVDTVVRLTEPVVSDADQSLSEIARGKEPETLAPELFSDDRSDATMPPVSSEPGGVRDRRRRRTGDHSAFAQDDDPYRRMRRRDDLFRYLERNLMEVNFAGKVFIKQGTIYSYSGNLTFWVKPQREGSVPPLVIVSGTGKLILTDGQREISVMRVNDEKIFVEPHHLLACQDTLTPRYAVIERKEEGHKKLHVLAIEGAGLIALSVSTAPLLISVKEEFPVNVSSANVISWSGGLRPAIVEDDALAELMLPSGKVGVNLRLTGEGQVMMEKHKSSHSD